MYNNIFLNFRLSLIFSIEMLSSIFWLLFLFKSLIDNFMNDIVSWCPFKTKNRFLFEIANCQKISFSNVCLIVIIKSNLIFFRKMISLFLKLDFDHFRNDKEWIKTLINRWARVNSNSEIVRNNKQKKLFFDRVEKILCWNIEIEFVSFINYFRSRLNKNWRCEFNVSMLILWTIKIEINLINLIISFAFNDLRKIF